MSKKCMELAKQKLDPQDRVQGEYEVRFDGKTGWLVMSFRKVLFFEEKGFLSKKYDLRLDLPYENIDNIALKKNQLVITDSENLKHICTSRYVNLLTIRNNLNFLVQQVLSKIIA